MRYCDPFFPNGGTWPPSFGGRTSEDILSLVIPEDANDNALHLQVELSENEDFSSPAESVDTSVSQENVQVFDGTEWIAYPAAGVGTPYYENRVAITLQSLDSNKKYYFRYRWHDGTAYTDWKSGVFAATSGGSN